MRPTVVTGVTLGVTADNDGRPSGAGGRPRRQTHPRRESKRPEGTQEGLCPQGAGDNSGRRVDDTPPVVTGPVDNVWTELLNHSLSRL